MQSAYGLLRLPSSKTTTGFARIWPAALSRPRASSARVPTGLARRPLHNCPAQAPDVVLMDINLPKMNGIECVRQLKALVPSAQVLMLTVYEDSDKIFNSLLAGASGYLLKRTPQAEILEAIADVHPRQFAHDGSHRAQGRAVFQPARRLGRRSREALAARTGGTGAPGARSALQGDCRRAGRQHRHRARAYQGHLREAPRAFPRRGRSQVFKPLRPPTGKWSWLGQARQVQVAGVLMFPGRDRKLRGSE